MLFIFRSKESLRLSKWLGSPRSLSPVTHKGCPCKLLCSRVVHSDFDMDICPPPLQHREGNNGPMGVIRFLKLGEVQLHCPPPSHRGQPCALVPKLVVFVIAHCRNMHDIAPHGATAAEALISSSAVVQEGSPEG